MKRSHVQILVWGAALVPVVGAIGLMFAGREVGGGNGRDLPGWRPNRRDEARKIWALASVLENISGWQGLGDYLVAAAWTESQGNPAAGSSAQDNAARGWFGIRPGTADHPAVTRDPNLLKNRKWAVAVAADLAERLGRKYSASAQSVDWLAIRRGWAIPKLVADVNETMDVNLKKPGTDRYYAPGERSADVRERFEDALAATGLPEEFMYAEAFPPGMVWPGVDQALAALGAA